MQILDQLKKTYDKIKTEGIYPDIYIVSGSSTGTVAEVNGKEGVNIFCSNNYLGLSNLPEVKDEIKKGVDSFGMGSGGSRLISGNIAIQEKLEDAIATFIGSEKAITFSSGFATNIGIIPALMQQIPLSLKEAIAIKLKFGKKKSVIFSDAINHASIVDGCRLSKAERVVYKHCDIVDLRKKLTQYKKTNQKLIVTDGVFSMDGDIAPLDKIVELAEEFDALILVDDAHAVGVLGDNGRGTPEYFNLECNKRIIQMGTFTKAFGAIGGFVSGPAWLVDYFRVAARTYVFSAPVPPAIAQGIIKSIDVISSNPSIRQKMWDNVMYVKKLLDEADFNTLHSPTQIIPVIIGNEKASIDVARFLLQKGIMLPSVRWPATDRGNARLRLTISADHTKEQMDGLVRTLIEAKKKFNF